MALAAGEVEESRTRRLWLAASGDEAAFAEIVGAHNADMTRVCFVICGDLDLAEEAVQDAWPRAWRKLSTLRDPARLRPWLISVAANEARQLLRRRARRSIVELDVNAASMTAPDVNRVSDLDLVNALARLSPDDRTLLAWRYVAGYDATEIARATGRSPSGTRTRLHRLLLRLRLELGDA